MESYEMAEIVELVEQVRMNFEQRCKVFKAGSSCVDVYLMPGGNGQGLEEDGMKFC
jgi:hypothetical protein